MFIHNFASYLTYYKKLFITTMKKKEMSLLADMIADRIMARIPAKKEAGEDEYVTTAEAAHILGISENYMRALRHNYPHIKRGNEKQGHLLFQKSALVKGKSLNSVTK